MSLCWRPPHFKIPSAKRGRLEGMCALQFCPQLLARVQAQVLVAEGKASLDPRVLAVAGSAPAAAPMAAPAAAPAALPAVAGDPRTRECRLNKQLNNYMCIHAWSPPLTTRTPLKNTVNTDTNAVFPNQILELFLQFENTSVNTKNPKIQKSNIPKIQKSKNPKNNARFRRCEKFWIFGFLECWISGCLYSGSLWISAHQELHYRVP